MNDAFACGNAKDGFIPPKFLKIHQDQRRRGLCVGKFWPFHRGHQYLFEQALNYCDGLYIIVCYKAFENPSGLERLHAIQEVIPTAFTMLIFDVYDPHDSKLWAELSLQWCRFRPDIVFTSESYGETWAKELRCEHRLIDIDRSVVPISGTLLRSNPFGTHWQYLTTPMKRYYCRRIVIVGSESTGKTTLAQQLAAHYGTVWVPEYGRELCERKLLELSVIASGGSAPAEFTFMDEDFREIIEQQSQREDLAAGSNEIGVIFGDTNSWATLIWYERYMKKSIPTSLLELQAKLCKKPVLYLLLEVEGSVFVQDGL